MNSPPTAGCIVHTYREKIKRIFVTFLLQKALNLDIIVRLELHVLLSSPPCHVIITNYCQNKVNSLYWPQHCLSVLTYINAL